MSIIFTIAVCRIAPIVLAVGLLNAPMATAATDSGVQYGSSSEFIVTIPSRYEVHVTRYMNPERYNLSAIDLRNFRVDPKSPESVAIFFLVSVLLGDFENYKNTIDRGLDESEHFVKSFYLPNRSTIKLEAIANFFEDHEKSLITFVRLSNNSNESPITQSVGLELGLSGWTVIGYGERNLMNDVEVLVNAEIR